MLWEYGWYDSHPDGDWMAEPKPQENPMIFWYVFGILTHETAESAAHTGSKSVWGQAIIVRRRKGSTEWEHVEPEPIRNSNTGSES